MTHVTRRHRLRVALLGVLAILAGGCSKQLTRQPAPEPRVEALFDPTAVDADGNPAPVLPTPTDLAKDPESGLLTVPTAAGASAAQAELDDYLRGLDGYPPSSVAEVRLSAALAERSQEPESLAEALIVVLVDSADPTKAERVNTNELSFSYSFNSKDGVARVRVASKAGWPRGRQVVMFVDGSKLEGEGGQVVVRAPTFELVAREQPICILEDGACVFNHSSLLERQVEAQIVNAPANKDKSREELDKLIAAAVLEQATALERLRAFHRRLLELGVEVGLKLEDIAVAWGFSIVAMPEAIFDPTAAQPALPGPANDLLLAQADDPDNGCTKGHVCIPKPAGEKSADAALRLGLNRLDGFSVSAPFWARFTAPLDPQTVNAESVRIVNTVDPTEQLDVTISYRAAERAVVITPDKPLREKTRYAVVLLSKPRAGSGRAAGGLADPDGNRVAASPVTQLTKSTAPLVDGDGRSLVSSIDDASAVLLEQLRQAYAPLYGALPLIGAKREDVVVAWVFTTQSISAPLVALRAAALAELAKRDSGKPLLTGSYEAQLSGYPSGVAQSNLAGWVSDGRFIALNALDPATRTSRSPDKLAAAETWQVPFWLTVPKQDAAKGIKRPEGGWPVAVFLHGIGSGKVRGLRLADSLAARGIATLGFDAPFHGDRTICTEDRHCNSGSCDEQRGACGGDGTLKDSDDDRVPDASGAIGVGAAFFDTANPFVARDNVRQIVLDTAALLRALSLGGAAGISAVDPEVVTLDPTRIHFVGQSMGSMVGTMLLAIDSVAGRSALAVPGSSWVFGIAQQSETFAAAVAAVRKVRGVQAGSLAELTLLTTYQWILDRADPGAFARYVAAGSDKDRLDDPRTSAKVTAKVLIVFKGTADKVIPPAAVQRIADTIGVDTTDTTYANQGHGLLLRPSPDAKATAVAQQQLAEFFVSGKICKPDVALQACRLE